MEELNEIRAYDAAKSENETTIPFDPAPREINNGMVS